jgi:hypothetical protein
MKLQRFEWRPVAAAAALTCSVSSAFAEIPQDRFWGQLEYFYPTVSTTARFDATATARPGTTFSLEQDLDLGDRKGLPYLDLGMRLGENWRIEFEYYKLDRSGTKTISRQIDVGDTTFPVGATVSTTFDSTIYRLTGGWSFIKTEQAELGLGFGLHSTDFKTQLSGQGTGPLGLGFQAEGHNQLVPLPTLGLYGTYMATPQLALRGRVDYLSLKTGDYDGRLMNWLAVVDWRFTKNFGAGVGYRYVDYRVSATKTNFNGEVQYNFKGPTIFVNMGF